MKDFETRKKPLIIAHRGASINIDENTLASFQEAIELHADMIEFDVQETLDHVAIVFHDADLKRTTNGSGLVSEHTFDSIKKLATKSGYPISSLEESLHFLKDKIDIIIELKEVSASSIIPLIKNIKGSYNFLIGSFSSKLLKEFKDFQLIGILDDSARLDEFLNIPVSYLALDATLISDELMKRLKEKKITVFAWTVDDLKLAQKLAYMGVDGIITNNPKKLKQCLKIND
jgi:glycerophosphoryl diester phosphodiesterase